MEVDKQRVEEKACFSNPPAPTIAEGESGETVIENPCVVSDWIEESFQPIVGLFYGPVYLIFCALPYWLIFGRKLTHGLTRQIAWVAAGALAIEWAAIVSWGNSIDPFGYAFEAAGLCSFRVRGPSTYGINCVYRIMDR